MNPRKFSLLLAGIIWIVVSLRIGSRAVAWLEPHFQEPSWMLSLLVVSLGIGLLKANTVLKKAVERNTGNLEKIDDKAANYAIGWLKLFGSKGLIIISLMIAMGFGLRYLKALGADPYDIFGFIYLGIAFAMAGASTFYFKAVARA